MDDLNSIIANVDDPTLENEEVEEVKKNEEEEVKDTHEDVVDSSGKEQDDGPGKVAKLLQKIGIGKVEDEPDSEEEEDIPDEFTDAAKAQGWSDEDIIEFAHGLSDKELIETIPTLQVFETDAEPDKDTAKHEDDPQPPQDKLKLEDDAITALKDEIRKEFQTEIDGLKSRLGEVSKDTEARSQQEMVNTVNEVFDTASEEFEVFGKTKELLTFPAGPNKGQVVPTSPQMKARSEVWDKAKVFIEAGISTKDAMQDALTWYKGKYLEKDIHRNLVKDLKKHETKLSARRSGKETVKSYEDEDERRADVVREAARKRGVTLEE